MRQISEINFTCVFRGVGVFLCIYYENLGVFMWVRMVCEQKVVCLSGAKIAVNRSRLGPRHDLISE